MKYRAKFVPFFAMLLVGIASTLLWASNLPHVRTFQFQYVTRISNVPQDAEKLRLWIPVPQSDSEQAISNLVASSPVSYVMHHDPEYHNRYIYMEVSPRALKLPLEVRINFSAERREHLVDLNSLESQQAATRVKPADLSRYLQPDRLVPIRGVIAELAEQATRGLQDPLEKARAIYKYVVATMRYDKSGEGWGRGDAIYACNVRKGNCTDFHALLIGMMRAAGIPARFEIGFPLPRDQHEGEIPGYHCWALFYLDGVGWVPVDASEAWKDPARRSYFFGAHDEHRVLFTRGRDIRFNPAQQGEPLNYFIYPYAELDGKPFNAVEHKFLFHDLPGQAR